MSLIEPRSAPFTPSSFLDFSPKEPIWRPSVSRPRLQVFPHWRFSSPITSSRTGDEFRLAPVPTSLHPETKTSNLKKVRGREAPTETFSEAPPSQGSSEASPEKLLTRSYYGKTSKPIIPEARYAESSFKLRKETFPNSVADILSPTSLNFGQDTEDDQEQLESRSTPRWLPPRSFYIETPQEIRLPVLIDSPEAKTASFSPSTDIYAPELVSLDSTAEPTQNKYHDVKLAPILNVNTKQPQPQPQPRVVKPVRLAPKSKSQSQEPIAKQNGKNTQWREQQDIIKEELRQKGYTAIGTKGVFTCSMCQKEFASRVGCDRHASTVHILMKFECSFCNQKFSRSDSLKRHVTQRCVVRFGRTKLAGRKESK